MFIFAFGTTLVPHSPSWRVRKTITPSSTGLKNCTTHAGVDIPMKSRLPANETEDSTLQAPGSSMAASSTTKAPPAARA